MVEEAHPWDDRPSTVSIYDDPFFRRMPAMAALKDTPQPNTEHIRACLMEMSRHLILKEKAQALGIQGFHSSDEVTEHSQLEHLGEIEKIVAARKQAATADLELRSINQITMAQIQQFAAVKAIVDQCDPTIQNWVNDTVKQYKDASPQKKEEIIAMMAQVIFPTRP